MTGTLDATRLPPQMHDILKTELQIKEFTYCPSMYHDSKRTWKPNDAAYVQTAEDVDKHWNLIVDEIDRQLLPVRDLKDTKRPVLVFFRDADEIQRFRASHYFLKYKDPSKSQVLTELTAKRSEDREHIIRETTRQGKITLASRMYGRGTDFKINDDRVVNAGGLHVIQTFFSSDLSEEVQIMGRCARQGDEGSYSQVLLTDFGPTSNGFDVTPEMVQKWNESEVYSKLSQERADKSSAAVQSLRDLAKGREQEHEVPVHPVSGGSG